MPTIKSSSIVAGNDLKQELWEIVKEWSCAENRGICLFEEEYLQVLEVRTRLGEAPNVAIAFKFAAHVFTFCRKGTIGQLENKLSSASQVYDYVGT